MTTFIPERTSTLQRTSHLGISNIGTAKTSGCGSILLSGRSRRRRSRLNLHGTGCHPAVTSHTIGASKSTRTSSFHRTTFHGIGVIHTTIISIHRRSRRGRIRHILDGTEGNSTETCHSTDAFRSERTRPIGRAIRFGIGIIHSAESSNDAGLRSGHNRHCFGGRCRRLGRRFKLTAGKGRHRSSKIRLTEQIPSN